jgi:hypothetical protein
MTQRIRLVVDGKTAEVDADPAMRMSLRPSRPAN